MRCSEIFIARNSTSEKCPESPSYLYERPAKSSGRHDLQCSLRTWRPGSTKKSNSSLIHAVLANRTTVAGHSTLVKGAAVVGRQTFAWFWTFYASWSRQVPSTTPARASTISHLSAISLERYLPASLPPPAISSTISPAILPAVPPAILAALPRRKPSHPGHETKMLIMYTTIVLVLA